MTPDWPSLTVPERLMGPKEIDWVAWGGWFANYDGEFDGALVRQIFDAGYEMREELRAKVAEEREACALIAEAGIFGDRVAATIRSRGVC